MENIIKTVKVFDSKANYHNGDNLGPGVAVIVDPSPKSEHQKWQIAQAVRYALEGMVLEDE